jgi:hypothetical protein
VLRRSALAAPAGRAAAAGGHTVALAVPGAAPVLRLANRPVVYWQQKKLRCIIDN